MDDIRKQALMRLRKELISKRSPLEQSQMAESFKQEQGRAPSEDDLMEYNERIQPRGMKSFNDRRLAEIMAQLPAELQADKTREDVYAKKIQDNKEGLASSEKDGYFSGAWDADLPKNPVARPEAPINEIDPDLVKASEKAWSTDPYNAEHGRQAAAIQSGVTQQGPLLKKLMSKFGGK